MSETPKTRETEWPAVESVRADALEPKTFAETPRVVPHVYQAIANLTGKMAKEGIAKDRKNLQQGYQFRGIDDVYNALGRHLADEGLCILPEVLSREVTERATQKGGVLFYVVVRVDFSLVSARDGSMHHIIMYGEAMDSADKATNKAMSAAYKYACLEAFCIPTEGDNDADHQTHEVAAVITAQQAADLLALAEEVGVGQAKVLDWLKVSDAKEIKAADYGRVIKALEKKRAS